MNSQDFLTRTNYESFTPEDDIIVETEDGRTIQAAVAGVPMPMAEAKRLGAVKDETQTEDAESGTGGETAKQRTSAATKSKKPAESK